MSLITRRSFFLGLIAAPVIVRASSLMPISAKMLDLYPSFGCFFAYEGGYSLDDPIIYRLELLNETWISGPGTHAYFSGAFV